MTKFNWGLFAEYVTIFLYKIAFYRILHHRKRYYTGEIDIIALRNNQIVFIEVKARSNKLDDRLLSLKQQDRIKKSASLFLSRYTQYQHYNIRFDLVIIRPYKLPMIIKNAW